MDSGKSPRGSIAIHPDDYSVSAEKYDASSPLWSDLLQKAGYQVKWVDVRRPDILEQIRGCGGFMWRWPHFSGMGRIARRLLPVIERTIGVPVYPDQNTCWHYDDKIAQSFLLQAANIPIPRTWTWFDRVAAKEWAAQTVYPLVLKLAAGAGSTNVRLIHNEAEAQLWIDRLFSRRVVHLDEGQFQPLPWKNRLRTAAHTLRWGGIPVSTDDGFEPQSGYVLFQEFLPGNEFDNRVTVVGRRAFAYRRFNRPNDFRASGSGNFSPDPDSIDQGFVRLAFKTARAINSQSCAIDGLYRNKERVVGEISYCYVSWMVRSCPGHWELDGEPDTGTLSWVAGQMWPEEAQIADFLPRLDRHWQSL